jgi:hypothetical protein
MGDGYDGEALGQWSSLASLGIRTRHRIRASLIDVVRSRQVYIALIMEVLLIRV